MKTIFIALILTTFLVSACQIFQQQQLNQERYFKDQEIATNYQCSNYVRLNNLVESRIHQKTYTTSPKNQELITLFYKLLTIQV
ncbi:unnamed protein product [Paramecium primaurelia]|uniref:Lipoprotein n=1 Tax=Paramecium primaurelia TaxID=5886 RepID=A0A8S1NUB9_PARPR|nr:unnamed protein product [Paramecium primaurelia]